MTDYKDRVSGWVTDIDWSKAPEGATHYFAPFFYKAEGPRVWLFDEKWELSSYSTLQIDERGFKHPAPQWNGEGLPPVGTSVLLDDARFPVFDDYQEMIGVPVVVTAAFKSPTGVDMIACALPVGLCGCFRADMARPGKNPAQIAADEREAAIEAMIGKIKDHPLKYQSVSHFAQLKIQEDACADLYDAGLRFQKGEDQ